jgi:hypothetical protein
LAENTITESPVHHVIRSPARDIVAFGDGGLGTSVLATVVRSRR